MDGRQGVHTHNFRHPPIVPSFFCAPQTLRQLVIAPLIPPLFSHPEWLESFLYPSVLPIPPTIHSQSVIILSHHRQTYISSQMANGLLIVTRHDDMYGMISHITHSTAYVLPHHHLSFYAPQTSNSLVHLFLSVAKS